jgi:membrane associated rhomboid family serine protease
VTGWIIALNIAVYLLAMGLFWGVGINVFHYLLPLSLAGAAGGRWWEFFTYMWMHAGPGPLGLLHIFCNMATLWMFGRVVEQAMGRWAYGVLYGAAGLVAGGGFVLEYWIRGGFSLVPYMADDQPIVGASGAVMGVVAALACLRPDARVMVVFFPVPARISRVVFWFCLASVVLMFVPVLSFIGHSAHLAGAAAGFVGYGLFRLWRGRGPVRSADVREYLAGDDLALAAWDYRLERDRIAQKIACEGWNALTPAEQEFIRVMQNGRGRE